MQDTSQDDKSFSLTSLKAENIELKAENFELKATNKALTERCEQMARLVLDLQETVKQLKDEINRLKGQKSRPKFPPANLNKGDKGKGNETAKQRSSPASGEGLKKIKHQEIIVTPPNVPEGSRFKGYSDFHVEDLSIKAVKIKYRLAVYETPSGEILRGRLPFNLNGKHFGPELIAYCLDQYHGRCVTRPQLLEQLHGFGVEISSGELDNLLIERDIREYVKKRKISGSTRSELGRKARDTFASLKKTCRKLGICFWEYLRDRTGRLGQIKPLSDLIAEKAAAIPA